MAYGLLTTGGIVLRTFSLCKEGEFGNGFPNQKNHLCHAPTSDAVASLSPVSSQSWLRRRAALHPDLICEGVTEDPSTDRRTRQDRGGLF